VLNAVDSEVHNKMKLIVQYLLRTVFFLLLIAAGADDLPAQVKAIASANKKNAFREDLVTIQFNIENADRVQQFIPPSFNGFRVVQGPMHVSGSSTVNGNETKYVSFVYVLQPQLSGKYALSGASAKVNGKRVVFNTVHINVNSSGHPNNQYSFPGNIAGDADMQHLYSDYVIRKGEDVRDKIRKNLFIKVDADKTSCYEGEPLVATYKLYTRLHSESKVARRPSFNGFSVYDMIDPSSVPSTIEKLNGKDFNVYLIRKAQLFPLQSGTLQLDPAEVENEITFLRADYAMKDKGEHLNDLLNAFGADDLKNEGIETENVTIRSNPVHIEVKALPAVTKPHSFDGAVGSFAVQATIDHSEVYRNDVAVMKVMIKGEGNFGVINSPSIKWPKGIEVFEPSIREDYLKSVVPMRGYKTFEYRFVPRQTGDIIIPPVAFSYFDPHTNAYQTIHTDSLQVRVIPEAARENDHAGSLNDNEGSRSAIHKKLVIGIAGILLIIFGIILSRLIRSSVRDTEESMPAGMDQKPGNSNTAQNDIPLRTVAASPAEPLFKARVALVQQDCKLFYKELNMTLRNYIANKLSLSSPHLDIKALEQEMKMKGVDDIVISQCSLVIQQCEIALYTPSFGETDMQAAYDLTDEIIQTLESK
jgi:hypothetical protein